MSVETVKTYLDRFGKAKDVLEFDSSSATVELAAKAVGVIPARIAKTLSFANGEGCLLVVAAGDARIDNKRFKAQFGMKARMLTPEDAIRLTGHAVGGVCPFDLEGKPVEIYLDVSLGRFQTVYPAAGSSNSAIELTCEQLEQYSGSLGWVDVCKGWQDEQA